MTDSVYAPFWRRSLALIIDLIFFSFLFYVILKISYNLFFPNIRNIYSVSFFDMIFILCTFFIPILFTVMLEIIFISSPWQATPGKKTLNIFIGHKADAIAISKFKAFCRILLKYLIILLTLVGVSLMRHKNVEILGFAAVQAGVLLVSPAILSIFSTLFGKEKMSIHDFVCTTRVYKGTTN